METDNKKAGQRIIIASILLIIFFFLPWFEIHWLTAKISYSGWDLPKVASDAQDMLQVGNQFLGTNYSQKIGKNIVLLYLIPALGGLLIYFAFHNDYKYCGYIELAIVLVVAYLFYIFFIDISIDRKFIGYGLIGTFGVSIFMLFDAFKNLNIKINKEKAQQVSSSVFSYEKYIFYGLLVVFILYAIIQMKDSSFGPRNPNINYNPDNIDYDSENNRNITREMADTMTCIDGQWYGNSQLPKNKKE